MIMFGIQVIILFPHEKLHLSKSKSMYRRVRPLSRQPEAETGEIVNYIIVIKT